MESIEKENAKLDEPFVFVRRFLADTEEMARPRWEAEKARHRAEYAAAKERILRDITQAKSSQHARREESIRVLEATQPWLSKYAEALEQTKAAVSKEIDAAYDKSHTAEVRTVFRYREGLDAELVDSALFVDGKKRSSTIPVYLLDPKRMQEYISYASKDGFGMGVALAFLGQERKRNPARGTAVVLDERLFPRADEHRALEFGASAVAALCIEVVDHHVVLRLDSDLCPAFLLGRQTVRCFTSAQPCSGGDGECVRANRSGRHGAALPWSCCGAARC